LHALARSPVPDRWRDAQARRGIDALSDLVLHDEDVFNVAVVFFRPDVVPRICFN